MGKASSKKILKRTGQLFLLAFFMLEKVEVKNVMAGSREVLGRHSGFVPDAALCGKQSRLAFLSFNCGNPERDEAL